MYGGMMDEEDEADSKGPASSDYEEEERSVLSDVFDEEQVEALITAIKLCVDRRMGEADGDEKGKGGKSKGSDALAILIGGPKEKK